MIQLIILFAIIYACAKIAKWLVNFGIDVIKATVKKVQESAKGEGNGK